MFSPSFLTLPLLALLALQWRDKQKGNKSQQPRRPFLQNNALQKNGCKHPSRIKYDLLHCGQKGPYFGCLFGHILQKLHPRYNFYLIYAVWAILYLPLFIFTQSIRNSAASQWSTTSSLQLKPTLTIFANVTQSTQPTQQTILIQWSLSTSLDVYLLWRNFTASRMRMRLCELKTGFLY